jgi:hypothetical protein
MRADLKRKNQCARKEGLIVIVKRRELRTECAKIRPNTPHFHPDDDGGGMFL